MKREEESVSKRGDVCVADFTPKGVHLHADVLQPELDA